MTRKDYIYTLKIRDDYRRLEARLVSNPAASASISSGSGSRSYTHHDLAKVREIIHDLDVQLAEYRASNAGGEVGISYPRYC